MTKAVTTETHQQQSEGVGRRFRADIQGLRAIAVVLVVLDHAFAWPSGGFVGVDVFYVISGYLITGLLLRELEQTGSISLRAFYARRVRRIAPAAVLVLVVTVVGAFVIWFTPRALQTALDAFWALLFVSNWHFASQGTDYLQADGPVSPVQHYWSLSIEEQFYAVWPLALLALFWLLRNRLLPLIAVIVAGIALSLAWAAWQTSTEPTVAYFDTFARVWELLAGALLAALHARAARGEVRLGRPRGAPKWSRQLLSAIGLILIVVGAVVVQVDWPVPFPWVAPAVLGAVLVIAANASAGRASVLGNPVSQWLGEVSYSLYLWHFPVLVFAASLFGDAWYVPLACLPVMLVVSALSRRYVERGFLRSGFLRRTTMLANPRPLTPRDLLTGIGVLLVISVVALAAALGRPALLHGATTAAQKLGIDTPPISSGEEPTALAEFQANLENALAATSWPQSVVAELDVNHVGLLSPYTISGTSESCLNDVFSAATEVPSVCGNIDEAEVLVVGDSIALAYVPGVVATGHSTAAVGYAGCSLFDASYSNPQLTPGFAEHCAQARERLLAMVRDVNPDVLVLSARGEILDLLDVPVGSNPASVWDAAVSRTFAELADIAHVIVLSPPPAGENIRECATRLTSPSQCSFEISDDWDEKLNAEQLAAENYPNAAVVDTRDWFCAEGQCPAFAGGNLIRYDSIHLTATASAQLAPLMARILP